MKTKKMKGAFSLNNLLVGTVRPPHKTPEPRIPKTAAETAGGTAGQARGAEQSAGGSAGGTARETTGESAVK